LNWEVVPSSRNGLNVIGLALISTTFGYVLSKMGDQGKILLDIFETLNEASIIIIKKVMW
jgi:Na+/H+-dicarboxylate symporter